jgi:hypothetical protein
MTPTPTTTTTPASIRNAEQKTRDSRRDEALWDDALSARLRKQTNIKILPSIQMQAQQDYEVAKYGVMNRRGLPHNLTYNLYDDTVRLLSWAHDVLTKPCFLKDTGFTKRTAPRRALQHIAKAYGYRYLRGLIAIEDKLALGSTLVKFRHERTEFRQTLELSADTAHAINDKGQNPAAVLEVVQMFAIELLALCPWLELVGHKQDAKILRVNILTALDAPTQQQ